MDDLSPRATRDDDDRRQEEGEEREPVQSVLQFFERKNGTGAAEMGAS